jgi:uncharacterized protein YbbK (DUF523 family)
VKGMEPGDWGGGPTSERRDARQGRGPTPSSTDSRPVLVVSACLLGVACNHEGRGSPRPVVRELEARYRLIPVCPEVLGGLTTPRPAAEIRGGAVVNTAGEDVSAAYRRGAEAAVAVARAAGATRAVLKARSPSCGASAVYDGSFSRTLVAGEGVTAAALRAAGLDVCSDEEAGAALP